MMKLLRLICLIVPLLWSGQSRAETIAATYTWVYSISIAATCKNQAANCQWAQAALEACQGWGATQGYTNITWPVVADPQGSSYVQCKGDISGFTQRGFSVGPLGAYHVYICPANQNWTLNGQSCTRDDCPYGRNAQTGTCNGKCESGAGSMSVGWYIFNVGATPNGAFCQGGCAYMMQADPSQSTYYTNGKKNRVKMQSIKTGGECTQADNMPAPSTAAESPPEPPKEPVCDAGEGVLTSSSGKVHCVPSSVPDAPKPRVEKSSNVQKFGDGSQQTTETTKTTDPETGVTDTRTKTTNTEKTGGGTGQAGTPGTTNGSGQNSVGNNANGTPDGSGNSEFCAKNPGLQICKGGMNEEATQKKVLESLDKVKDSVSAENFDAKDHIADTINASEAAKGKLDEEKDKVLGDINKFGTAADPSSGFYSQFQTQMNGWLGDIPVVGCSPFTARIGPYSWTLDHCAKAYQISEIFGYCLWVMLAFGVFSLATRNGRGS